MSARTSASFLIVCFLLCACSGQKIITAELGQDVILPCKVPNNNINIRAVEWVRLHQELDYVLFYRDPDNQHPSYQNRVDLQDKDMKDGDFSLILKNVKKNDTGIFECRVFEKGKNEPISITYVEVVEPAQTNIPAGLGQNKVILPCKVPNNNNINNITAVEWSRPGLDPDHVLLYRGGRIDPDNQHPSYQNRVDLQDMEMRDVSLILKNVTKNDTGIYECRVFDQGKYELISITNLEVCLSGEKVGGHEGEIIVGSVVVVILLLLAVLGSVGFSFYRRHMKKNPNLPVPPDEPPVRYYNSS